MFPLQVSSSIVSRLKYAAVFKESEQREQVAYPYLPLYVGDMPDTAIERTLQAYSLKRFTCLTIHSNSPMLVREAPQKVDPVIIGWLDYPRLSNEVGKPLRISEGCRVVDGLVIAMWDMDKEL